MSIRTRVMQFFLWVWIFGAAVALGAKIFDLLVVAGAWSAAPPASFALLPYGSRFPIDPGDFFQPLSAVIALGILGALISGWGTAAQPRFWLWIGVLVFLVVWAITPTVFWPMIHQLYGIATGKIAAPDAESIQLARRWITWDWIRTVLIAAGFIAPVQAISFFAASRKV